jgi:hypothetical protein
MEQGAPNDSTKNASPGPGEGEVAAALARIEAKIGEVRSWQTSRRRRVLLSGLALTAVALIFIWQVSLPFVDILQSPKAFLEAIEHEQAVTFLPILRHEFQATVPQIMGAYEKAWAQAWNKRQARVQDLIKELDLMLAQVGRHLEQQAGHRVQTFLERYHRRLEHDFPQLANDDEAMAAIREALGAALTSVIGARFHQPFETLAAMRETFLGLTVPDQLRQMPDDQLQERMLDQIAAFIDQRLRALGADLDLVREALAGLEHRLLTTVPTLAPERTAPATMAPAANPTGGQP